MKKRIESHDFLVTEASSAETPRWSKNEREIAIEGKYAYVDLV